MSAQPREPTGGKRFSVFPPDGDTSSGSISAKRESERREIMRIRERVRRSSVCACVCVRESEGEKERETQSV